MNQVALRTEQCQCNLTHTSKAQWKILQVQIEFKLFILRLYTTLPKKEEI
jgi:hypothetical protein